MPRPTCSTSVKVFRDDAQWSRFEKYWMRRLDEIRELYVATYDLATDSDGDYCGDWEADSAWLVAQHPDCLFVYC